MTDNIHIICRDLHEDKVLPHLAKTLAEGTGWSLSEHPRKDASLNYWMVYIDLAERHSDWRHTPRAAYFSHYEPQTSFKRVWWERASRMVDGAILTARQYLKDLPNSVQCFTARPPIDPIFQKEYIPLHNHTKPRVGFSGFVDRSTRKGEWMVKRLQEELGDQIDFVACGNGWPVSTTLYKFEDLPKFYYSLDAFVCTSMIEGIPMPPLEAIMCNRRTLVPRGVGMLDDLPETEDIIHYTASDYDELKSKLLEAVLGGAKRDKLSMRSAVADYNAASWCADHTIAFDAILAREREPARVESDRHGSRGVLYVAYGDQARNCAASAITSFKTHMPDVPTALVSDRPLGPEDIFVPNKDEDIGGRSVKTKIYDLAPREWQYVMYLDADTEVIAPINFLFEQVESGWDLVITKNPGKYHSLRYMERSDNKDECEYTFNQLGTDQLIQLNGGVFVFQRNARTEAFFASWHAEWLRWGKRDQAALIRALFQNPLRVNVLTNHWNTITRYASPSTSAGILHYPMTARRWRGLVSDRLDSEEAWRSVRNFSEREKRK